MQPIIQRTITITITERWTITWADGHETTWHTTREVAWPAVGESREALPPDKAVREDDLLNTVTQSTR